MYVALGDKMRCMVWSYIGYHVLSMFDKQGRMPAIAAWHINGEYGMRLCTPDDMETRASMAMRRLAGKRSIAQFDSLRGESRVDTWIVDTSMLNSSASATPPMPSGSKK
jgi:hypothetical protein